MKNLFMAVLAAAAMLCGCGGGGGRNAASAVADVADSGQRVFRPATPPAMLTPEQQAGYLNEHFWDTFDFADTLFLAEADTMQMMTSFALYVQQFVPDSLAAASSARAKSLPGA